MLLRNRNFFRITFFIAPKSNAKCERIMCKMRSSWRDKDRVAVERIEKKKKMSERNPIKIKFESASKNKKFLIQTQSHAERDLQK